MKPTLFRLNQVFSILRQGISWGENRSLVHCHGDQKS